MGAGQRHPGVSLTMMPRALRSSFSSMLGSSSSSSSPLSPLSPRPPPSLWAVVAVVIALPAALPAALAFAAAAALVVVMVVAAAVVVVVVAAVVVLVPVSLPAGAGRTFLRCAVGFVVGVSSASASASAAAGGGGGGGGGGAASVAGCVLARFLKYSTCASTDDALSPEGTPKSRRSQKCLRIGSSRNARNLAT